MFSLYLDFKKAFDSVEHAVLLKKLYFYGIRGTSYEWLKSYLDNRKQFVNINKVNSNTKFLSHSVPQGSNLGPLLFLILINDLPLSSNLFQFTLVADDCSMSCAIDKEKLSEAHELINYHLTRVNVWLSSNKIKINPSKTKYLLYSYRNTYNLSSDIVIGDDVIGRTDRIKFLGVTLDDRLSYRYHICLLYTSPSPRDKRQSRMPSSA